MDDLDLSMDMSEDFYDPDGMPDFGPMLPVRNFHINPHEDAADLENVEAVKAIANGKEPNRVAITENSEMTYCNANRIYCSCSNCQKKVLLAIWGHDKCRRKNCTGCRHIKEEKEYLTKPSIGRLVIQTSMLDYYEISAHIENITGKRSKTIREGVNKIFTTIQDGTTTIEFNNVVLARLVFFNLDKLPNTWNSEYEDIKVIQHIDSSDDEDFRDTTYQGKKNDKPKKSQGGMLANPMQVVENLQDRKFAMEMDEIFKDSKKVKEEDEGMSETSAVIFVNMDEVNAFDSGSVSMVDLDKIAGDEDAVDVDDLDDDKENY